MKIIVGLHLLLAASAALADEPAWTKARQQAPQRGMIYEYYDVKNKPWVQGEGLDTMHDGAWFAVAMVNAYRATGDSFYKEFLTKRQLPWEQAEFLPARR